MIPSSFSWLPLLFVSFAKNSLTVCTNSWKIQLVMFLCPAVWVLYFSHCLLFSLNGKGVGLNMPLHPVCGFTASQKQLLILFDALGCVLCLLLSYRPLYFRVHFPMISLFSSLCFKIDTWQRT